LLEREHEIAQVRALLEHASGGEGSTVLIEGPAGIGKTEFLARIRDLAAEKRMGTLVARGGELEQDLPLVVVRALLAGSVERADEDERRELMAGAAALAAPVLAARETDDDGLASDLTLSAAMHGLFWLCSNLADRRPLLIAVDDVQWADAGSLRFLSYLAHRIADLPAMLALGRRTGEPGTDEALFGAIGGQRSTTRIELAALSRSAVAELLQASYAGPVADQFADACNSATGGNPFLMRELITALRDQDVSPLAENVRQVEQVRPRRVALAVRARLNRLPASAIELARATAVLGLEAELGDAARLAGIAEEEGQDAADALADAGLLEPRRPLVFSHPLIRSAIYDDLPRGRRATAHARAARQLLDNAAPTENVAVHLLHTEPARDDRVAELLREAAAISMDRGAAEQSATYLRRALTESPSSDQLWQVLRELGAAEVAAGDPQATEHLFGALASSPKSERAEIAELLTVALAAAGRHEEAVEMLRDVIRTVEAIDAEVALRLEGAMLSSACLSSVEHPMPDDLRTRLAELRGETPGERLMLASGAYYTSLYGAAAAEALPMAHRALAGDRLLAEPRVDAPPFWLANAVLLFADQHDEHETHLDVAGRDAARTGSMFGAVLVLGHRALNALDRGRVADSVADAHDCLRSTIATNWVGGLPLALAALLFALVEQGELTAAEDVLAEHGVMGDVPLQQLWDMLLAARSRLRLAQGRPESALADALELARRHAARGMSCAWRYYAWRPVASRAHAALGDRDGSREVAEEHLGNARRWGAAAPIAEALRACAAAEDGEARIGLLRDALEVLEGSDLELERMHVLLELGEALRRLRRDSESRGPLQSALDLAEPAGAGLVAERARSELAATGVTRRNRTFLSGMDALTPCERRAAAMAAAGMSNPEIAQNLFVTRKTVEKHLGNAYAKLDISSRKDLATMFPQEGAAGEE
jgi:DNA-binding CsgD family transcriptional regulator